MDRPREVSRTGQCERHGPDEENERRDGGGDQSDRSWPRSILQCRRMFAGRIDDDQDDADRHLDGEQRQHLGPDEKLQAHEDSEQDAHRDRTSVLSEQQLVEAENHERGDHDEAQVDMGRCQVVEHEGREAVEQTGDERGGCPVGPATEQGERAKRGQRGTEGQTGVQRGDRSEQPREWCQHDPERREHEVDAGRVADRCRKQRVVAVRDRVRGPRGEPDGRCRVATPTGGGRRRMPGPHVAPDHHRDEKIEAAGEDVREDGAAAPRPVASDLLSSAGRILFGAVPIGRCGVCHVHGGRVDPLRAHRRRVTARSVPSGV